MKRRNCVGVAAVLGAVMMLAGCSTEWIKEAEQIVAAMIPAAANLVALVSALEGKSVSAADLQAVRGAGAEAGADLQLVESLIAAYQKADAAARPGILEKVQSAIQAADGSLQGVLPALHIKDAATQAKVTAVVGILLAEVQALEAVVPGLESQRQNPHPVAESATRMGQPLGFSNKTPAPAAKSAASTGHPHVPLSAGEFVKAYNATLTAKTGNADVDRVTRGLKIHLHGETARVISAGVLR